MSSSPISIYMQIYVRCIFVFDMYLSVLHKSKFPFRFLFNTLFFVLLIAWLEYTNVREPNVLLPEPNRSTTPCVCKEYIPEKPALIWTDFGAPLFDHYKCERYPMCSKHFPISIFHTILYTLLRLHNIIIFCVCISLCGWNGTWRNISILQHSQQSNVKWKSIK